MTRRRVNLALVPNESARKTTFKKRKTGLMKKMDEITTLCGINGCLVIFNPKDAEPHIWPSKEKAVELLSKYERMPKVGQDMKKVDHERFMINRVERLREHVARREKKNREIRASMLMQQMTQGRKMEELNIEEVELLIWFSDMKLKAIDRQNILLPPIRKAPSLTAAMPPPPPASRPPPLVVQPSPVVGQGMFMAGTARKEGNFESLVVQPSPVVGQGMFMAGTARKEGNFESALSFQVDYDLSFMDMFGYGSADAADAGANGLWPGDTGTGNGEFNFLSGFEPGPSTSYPGFR